MSEHFTQIKLKPANRKNHPSLRKLAKSGSKESLNGSLGGDEFDDEEKIEVSEAGVVWIRDPLQAFVRARILSEVDVPGNETGGKTFEVEIMQDKFNKGDASAKTKPRKIKVKESEVMYNILSAKTEHKIKDLTKIGDLNEASLLQAIQARFNRDKVYTFTGPILIALNPFKELQIYEKDIKDEFAEKTLKDELRPHVFAIAHSAFLSMLDNSGRNQSILVSGESGAGKTVSTKLILDYLVHLSNRKSNNQQQATKSQQICSHIIEVNPLLETFGNAKTNRNDNSSRFGKFIQLVFKPTDPSYQSLEIAGGFIDTYLLEKSRVVHQNVGEQGFHIFYEILCGSSVEEREVFGINVLPELSECLFLNPISEKFGMIDYGKRFRSTLEYLEDISVTAEETSQILKVIVFICHLGNLKFVENNGDIAVADISFKHFDICCEILKTDRSTLERALFTRKISSGGEVVMLKHTLEQAIQAQHAMATCIYERLFLFIVYKTNKSLYSSSLATKSADDIKAFNDLRETRLKTTLRQSKKQFTFKKSDINKRSASVLSLNSIAGSVRSDASADSDNSDLLREMVPKRVALGEDEDAFKFEKGYVISLLDIFGFEVSERNYFEQFCINFANEVLQSQFNNFVFKLEQRLYISEGIRWRNIQFPDNQPIIRLFTDTPIGFFAIIDEECRFPKGNDRSLFSKIQNTLVPVFSGLKVHRKKVADKMFVVRHFAGDVEYSADGFVQKNKNEVREECVSYFRSSGLSLVRNLLPEDAATDKHGVISFSSYFDSVLGDERKANGDEKGPVIKEQNTKDAGNEYLGERDVVKTMLHRIKSGTFGNSTRNSRNMLSNDTSMKADSKIQQETMGFLFQLNLNMALSVISKAETHFIRCVKSNDQNKPDMLNRNRVLQQLNYSGVLEVIKVARAGYPSRMSYSEFVAKFLPLLSKEPGEDEKATTKELLTLSKLLPNRDYQLGKTLVFLKATAFTQLQVMLSKVVKKPKSREEKILALAKKRKWIKDVDGKIWRYNNKTALWEEFEKYKKFMNPWTMQLVFEPDMSSAKPAAQGFVPNFRFKV